MRRMLDSLKSLVKRPRRCGVCLFVLSHTAKPLDLDLDLDWMRAFETSDTLAFTFQQLLASIARDCSTCRALRSALERFGTVFFTSAQWDPCVVSGPDKHPLLVIDDTGERFELLTLDEDALNQGEPSLHPVVIKGGRLSGGSTGDEATLTQAAKWLDDCRKNHDLCGSSEAGFVPTRLLCLVAGDMLEDAEDPGMIRLVEHPDPSTVFAALSHRWTQETLAIRLLKANFDQRKHDGVRFSDLPLMMQHVVSTLRTLGIHHVWIDCLCIVQDDAGDWQREAARMASIYANAELTVAATWCSTGGEGLYRQRDSPTHIDIDIDNKKVFMRRALPHFRWDQIQGGTWASLDPSVSLDREWPLLPRGWVYQEQLLSRRTLHFLRNEILWECFATRACECGWHDRDAREGQGGPRPGKRPAAEKEPWRIIAEYAGRPLTFESDRLPAIAGIAKTVAKAKGLLDDRDAYVCGLFTNEADLRETLFWHLVEQPSEGRPESNIPSWSWASVTSTALGFWSYAHDSVEFLDVQATIPDGADPYMGHVESASITLRGRVLQAVIRHGKDAPTPGGKGFSIAVSDSSDHTWWTAFDADYKLDEPGKSFVPDGTPVACLLIGEMHSGECDPQAGTQSWRVSPCCIVLRCVSEDGEMRHERIGAYVGRESNGEQWLDLETFVSMSTKRQITLI